MKQASSRRAEKALQDILNKADDDDNGKVRLKDVIQILEVHDVKVSEFISNDNKNIFFQIEDEEFAFFSNLIDDNGEISKQDILVQTRQSDFWRDHMDLKKKPPSHSTKARKEKLLLASQLSQCRTQGEAISKLIAFL